MGGLYFVVLVRSVNIKDIFCLCLLNSVSQYAEELARKLCTFSFSITRRWLSFHGEIKLQFFCSNGRRFP